jgi:hypothetical protein
MADEAHPDVHRDLHLVTPLMHGADIRTLQTRLNEIAKEHDAGYHVREDSEFGEHTRNATHDAAFIMGLPRGTLKEIHNGDLSQVAQTHIRQPDSRPQSLKKRAQSRRRTWNRRLADAGAGADKAIAWARSKVGVFETPANSNRGPEIDVWQSYCGVSAVPWCGCFVAFAVCHEADAKVPDHTRLRYSGWIDYDARNGLNGMVQVPTADARAGDIGTLEFEAGPPTDHVVLITGPLDSGLLPTLEGNTSPSTAGSQFNGGAVAAKQRASGLFVTVARPTY